MKEESENHKGERGLMKKRLMWLDILKGLLILFVVIGHATGKYNKYIYQFHMAAFFMVSGYTVDYSKKSIVRFVFDRFVGLLLPFFTIFGGGGTILSTALYQTGVYHWIFPKDQIYIGIRQMLIELFLKGNNYVWWMGACWFVPVLFGALCIQRVLFDAMKSEKWRVVLSSLAFLYALSGNPVLQIGLFTGKLILIAQWYLMLGELTRKYRIIEQITERGAYFCSGVGLILVAVLVYAGEVAGVNMDWPSWKFCSPLQMMTVPVCDTLLFALVSCFMSKSIPYIGKVIAYLGKNSYPIMCFHFLMFKFGNALMVLLHVMKLEQINSFLPPLPETKGYWSIYVAIGCVFSILLWNMVNRLPGIQLLLGKKSAYYDRLYIWLSERINIIKFTQIIKKNIQVLSCLIIVLAGLAAAREWYLQQYLPYTIDFTQKQMLPDRVFREGWYLQNEGESFRFVSDEARILLKKPEDKHILTIEGFVPGNFTDVNTMTVYCGEDASGKQIELTAGEGFRYQDDLSQIQNGAECEIWIVFNTAHQWEPGEADLRKLSACISSISFQ